MGLLGGDDVVELDLQVTGGEIEQTSRQRW
jgi:hypothetical protein